MPPSAPAPAALRAIHGRLAVDGFAWFEHPPEAWPELCATWEAAAGAAKPWWLSILRRGAATLAWRHTRIELAAGGLAGGKLPPARCQWTASGPGAGALSLLIARGALAKLVGPLRGAQLPPAFTRALAGEFPELQVVPLPRAGFDMAEWALELLAPPGPGFTHALFYQARALEAVSLLAGGGGLAAPASALPAADGRTSAAQARRERLARERVTRAQALIAENLEAPLNLRELSRRVGCSPFYLSRTFSAHAGCTLQDFQRRARLNRAAELLRGGTHNVTEAAMAVGYSSLSHFTKAFRETFGCCPGLYPVAPRRAPEA